MIPRYQWREIEFVSYTSHDGVEYPLYGGKRALMSFSGLAMPDIRYITDSGPFINGVRVRDYRLDTRTIDFVQYERGCSRQKRWDNIGLMIDSIRMNRGGPGVILVVLPDGTQRAIGAWIQEGPAGEYTADSAQVAFDIRELLRFLAPYPVWYDPTSEVETFVVTPVDSCLPTCLPTCLGNGVIYTTVQIAYTGTFESFPTITITGPLSQPQITNITTGKSIELDYVVGAGEVVTIELTPYAATVTNNFGADLIGTVTNLNDLGSFSIVPEGLYVPGGINEILVQGAGGLVGVTAISITYFTNYLGVPR